MTMVPPEAPSPFDHLRRTRPDGSEFWSARELMPLLGYTKWENFRDAVREAREVVAAEQGSMVADHAFSWKQEKGTGGRSREDCHLARGACYVTAMRGDSRKAEIRAALLYFARKTREAEVAQRPSALPSNRDLALMVIAEADRADLAEAKVKELEPAAQSWQTLAAAEGDYSVADAAKFLSRDGGIATGRNRLFNSLLEMRWTYRQQADGRPRAMQYAVDRGWLSEIPQSHIDRETGESRVDAPQIRVTVKGLHELHKRLGGAGPLQLSA